MTPYVEFQQSVKVQSSQVNSALLRSSFLVLFQIVLLKCEKLPDLNEVNSRIREETARYYGNQPAHKVVILTQLLVLVCRLGEMLQTL